MNHRNTRNSHTCGKKKGSVRRETNLCSFRHESDDRAKSTPMAAPPSEPQSSKTRGRIVSRKRSTRGRSQSEKFNRLPCKYSLKGTCTKSPCEYWHPPECQFCKTESGCKFGAECLFPHWKVEEQSKKKPKKGDDKSAVAVCEKCATVGLCIAGRRAAGICSDGTEGHRSVGTNSTSTIHESRAASSKYPGKRKHRRLEKHKSKFIISEVPTL